MFFHQGVEVDTVEQLHHVVERSVLAQPEIVELDGVRRLEFHCHLSLALEASEPVRISRHRDDEPVTTNHANIGGVAALVFEIAFEGIQQSPRHKSGIALRFLKLTLPGHERDFLIGDAFAERQMLAEAEAGS